MEKLTFDGLQPEIFFAQPWFADFVEAFEEVLNERIRDPIHQLEMIRNITADTDPYVVAQALKQIGFNLPNDFIKHNMPRLAQSLQQLVLYSERSGTRDYTKLISFVLGRRVDAVGLYTQNYENFYPQPYGPLQVDGGEWFKTTHVELGMEMLASDYTLIVPRGKTLKDRFLDAFYEFAPWNIVVDRFFFQVEVEANLHISGRIFKHPTRYIDVGVGDLNVFQLQIVGPSEVFESTEHTYELVAVMRNDDGEGAHFVEKIVGVMGEWSSNKTGLVNWRGAKATFGNVGTDVTAVLYATYRGMSASIEVKVKNNVSNIQSIVIEGPDEVRAEETAHYTVKANTYDSVETIDLPLQMRSVFGYLNGNELVVNRLSESGDMYMTASLELPDGQQLNTVKKVRAVYVDPNVHLTGLRIEGPAQFYENEIHEYLCIATYSDDSERDVLALWDPNCGSIYITPDGTMYATETESDLDLTFRATHQYRGVVLNAELPVRFSRREVTITHTEILGPNTVLELSQIQYLVSARFSDGSTGYIDADWSSDRFYIDDRGILEVGSVGVTPVNLTLRAAVDGRVAIKQISAIDTPITLDNLLILGPDNLHEDSIGKYTAYAHYSNGRDVEIEPVWTVKTDPSWVELDSEGLMNFADPQLGIVELVATYTIGSRVLSQSKPVVLIPKTRIIQGLIVNGPTEVREGERIFLAATAVYSDGTMETVSPLWEVQSADPLNFPDAMADIVSPGVMQGRSVEEDTPVIAIARYFKEIAEYTITVKPYIPDSPDKPVSSRIVGPAAFSTSTRGSYAHMIVFEECVNELGVSSDWTIDVDPSIATIDGAGFVWSVNGKSAVATITSTYQCGTYTVIDSLLINILGREDVLKSLAIRGPDAIIGNNLTLYTAELFKVGETETEGSGTIIQPEWSILSPDGRVTVNGSGEVFVNDAQESFTFILKVTYSEDFETVEATKEINVIRNALPLYGVGPIGIRTDADVQQYLTNELPSLTGGQRVTLTAGSGQYMYFCYPASIGFANFRDVATDFVGGWDGASWPDDGDVGDQFGPIAIQRTNEVGISSTWYLYRTDFDGIGTFTYEITFE